MIEVRPIRSRAEWLDWRRDVLTASDIGAAAGVDAYRSRLSVYADKIGGIATEENDIMRRGRLFEAAAVEYLREEHPTWNIERPYNFCVDVDLKLGCTPDVAATTETGSHINIQIKVVSAPTFDAWNGNPPKSYLLQTACENMLTKADEGILAVLVVSTYAAELHEFLVPRHPAAERRICEIARGFWENVKQGLVPAPDYHQDADVIDALFPPDVAVPVPLDLSKDNRIGTVLEEREQLKETIKAAETSIKALNAEIVHKLDGATLATLDGWKITNKLTNRKEYTVKAASYPVLLASRVDTMEGPQ
jgi:predicted phage-related endonuclease